MMAQQWEYVELRRHIGMAAYEPYVQAQKASWYVGDREWETLTDALNALAEEGWECVAIRKQAIETAILTRPRPA
jgi:hypothetical protein